MMGTLSSTDDITFDNNTCYSAGHEWGHGQRTGENAIGNHLMLSTNRVPLTNFHIRNNIFSAATKWIVYVRRAVDITDAYGMD